MIRASRLTGRRNARRPAEDPPHGCASQCIPRRPAGRPPLFGTVLLYVGLITTALLSLAACISTPTMHANEAYEEATALFNEHDFAGAEAAYLRYIELNEAAGNYRNLERDAEVYRKLADIHEADGDYAYARTALTRAIELGAEAGLPDYSRVHAQVRVARLIGYTGDYQGQLDALAEVRDLAEPMADGGKRVERLAYAEWALYAGEAHYQLGNAGDDTPLVESALGVFRAEEYDDGAMRSALILGRVRIDAGQLDDAAELLALSLRTAEALGIAPAAQSAASGRLAYARGDYQGAIGSYGRALALAQEAKARALTSQTAMKLGDVYLLMRKFEQASDYYRVAGEALDETDAASLRASLAMRVGSLLAAEGEANASIPEFERAMAWYRDTGVDAGVALTALRIGQAHLNQGRFDIAEEYLSDARSLYTDLARVDGAALAAVALSAVRRNTGDLGGAVQVLDSVDETRVSPEVAWRHAYEKGHIAIAQGDTAGAVAAWEAAVNLLEGLRSSLQVDDLRRDFSTDRTAVYAGLVALLAGEGDAEGSWRYAELARARAFLDVVTSQQTVRSPGELSPEEETLLAEEERVAAEIRRIETILYGEDPPPRDDAHALAGSLAEAKNRYQLLLERVKVAAPDRHAVLTATIPDLDDVREVLQPGELVVDYWVDDRSLIVWLIDHESVRLGIVDEAGGREAIAGLVRQVRRDMRTISDGANEALRYGHQILIAAPQVTPERYDSLIVIPHDSLNYLPFQALFDGTDYLIESVGLTYAPSCASLVHGRSQNIAANPQLRSGSDEGPESDDPLIMALGDLSLLGNAPLPGTETEALRIAARFSNPTVLVGEQATEEEFKREARNHATIHLATHGLLDTAFPGFSAILLAPTEGEDGLLRVNEILGLRFDGSLCVLSACNTGVGVLGSGDEITSLARAFLLAGADSVIVSLWSVSDESTAELMSRFYAHRAAGATTRDAFAEAQRELIGQVGALAGLRGISVVGSVAAEPVEKAHPFFWAPFTIVE